MSIHRPGHVQKDHERGRLEKLINRQVQLGLVLRLGKYNKKKFIFRTVFYNV